MRFIICPSRKLKNAQVRAGDGHHTEAFQKFEKPNIEMSEPSYADDAACVFHLDPAEVEDKLWKASVLVWEKCVLAGFTVNFKFEKTAALIRWHGVGADIFKYRLVHTLKNKLQVQSAPLTTLT